MFLINSRQGYFRCAPPTSRYARLRENTNSKKTNSKQITNSKLQITNENQIKFRLCSVLCVLFVFCVSVFCAFRITRSVIWAGRSYPEVTTTDLPSSLTRTHPFTLALLRLPTCVGLRYGSPIDLAPKKLFWEDCSLMSPEPKP